MLASKVNHHCNLEALGRHHDPELFAFYRSEGVERPNNLAQRKLRKGKGLKTPP